MSYFSQPMPEADHVHQHAQTGQQLVEAFQSSPQQDLDVTPPSRIEMPVREVELWAVERRTPDHA